MMVRLKTGITLQIYEGSIVDCYTDAVVIPTTTTLEWEPEVARELMKKAGPSTVAAARRKAPLDIGEAVVTTSGGMLACFIIHVALPDTTGVQGMAAVKRQHLLETVIRNGLLRCTELSVPSIGLPNIGRRLGFSAAESAQLLLATLDRNLPDGSMVDEVHLVLRDSAEVGVFATSGGAACV
jgi:O-acetyl-ADP-ribose deacetylase (regulator of RNase III)